MSWETDHPTPLSHHPYPFLIMLRAFTATYAAPLAFFAGTLLIGGFIHASLVEARYRGCVLGGGLPRQCEQLANQL